MTIRVRYKSPSVYNFGQVRLLPGINRVDEKNYKSVSTHPMWQKRVASGVIVILDEVESPAASSAAVEAKPKKSSSSRRSAEDIIAEISDTFDHKTLSIYAEHRNKKIAEAARQRLAVVGPTEVKEG